MVYLIVCEETQTCKIGYSQDAQSRLVQLQTSNPFKLKLKAVISGDAKLEKEIHNKFKEFKLRGEWFEYNSIIKGFFEYYNIYITECDICGEKHTSTEEAYIHLEKVHNYKTINL